MKINIPYKLQLVLLGTILSFTQSISANEFCNASVISALKTQYTHVKSGSYSQAIYEAACSEKDRKSNFGLGLNIPDVAELSFSSSGSTIRKACYEKDSSFFSKYSDQVAFSILPDKAIDILSGCFGGLFLKATEKDNIVTIKASFTSPDTGNKATVDSFSWIPTNSMTCKDVPFKKGHKLIPGGESFSCKKTKNTSVAITLNTDHGEKSIWLERKPKIKVVKYKWNYDVKGGPNTGWTTCKNQEGDVGGAVDCRGDKTCGYVTPIRGLCLIRYGTGYTQVDTKRYEHKDDWSYQVKGGPTTGWTTCSLNGQDIGTPHNCSADNSCDNANSIRGWCAGRYGL